MKKFISFIFLLVCLFVLQGFLLTDSIPTYKKVKQCDVEFKVPNNWEFSKLTKNDLEYIAYEGNKKYEDMALLVCSYTYTPLSFEEAAKIVADSVKGSVSIGGKTISIKRDNIKNINVSSLDFITVNDYDVCKFNITFSTIINNKPTKCNQEVYLFNNNGLIFQLDFAIISPTKNKYNDIILEMVHSVKF